MGTRPGPYLPLRLRLDSSALASLGPRVCAKRARRRRESPQNAVTYSLPRSQLCRISGALSRPAFGTVLRPRLHGPIWGPSVPFPLRSR